MEPLVQGPWRRWGSRCSSLASLQTLSGLIFKRTIPVGFPSGRGVAYQIIGSRVPVVE